jgi:c-di-GMP-binding flagellar brake protein YcgR
VRERRQAPRIDLDGHVSLTLGDEVFEFPAADISVSGVGVLVDADILGIRPLGECGICRIASPELGQVVEAYVSVMRVRRLGERRLLGLRFESISDEELALLHEFRRKGRDLPAAS